MQGRFCTQSSWLAFEIKCTISNYEVAPIILLFGIWDLSANLHLKPPFKP